MQQSSEMDSTSEPSDVFCNIGALIVEGRLPLASDSKKFIVGEGPHVFFSNGKLRSHECSSKSNMCKKNENFRQHMLLLWQNGVSVSIEVLLCSDCEVGHQKANSLEFSTIPEPGSILLEKWNVSIMNNRREDNGISSRNLFLAIRSYLHFSQLSAWYSNSNGEIPKNVLFRITIPGEAFASKFIQIPVEHHFPNASVGNLSSVQVSVKSLPRSDTVPRVLCCHNSTNFIGEEKSKLTMAGSLAWKDSEVMSEKDFRKSIAAKIRPKNRMNDCSFQSSGSDSKLGDSLLDPPLHKIPPKRYQSPSRCGSPSLEAPEHLLFGKDSKSNYSSSSSSSKNHSSSHRRRKFFSKYNHCQTSEFLNNKTLLNDQMQELCTQSGKHICGSEEDEEILSEATEAKDGMQCSSTAFENMFNLEDLQVRETTTTVIHVSLSEDRTKSGSFKRLRDEEDDNNNVLESLTQELQKLTVTEDVKRARNGSLSTFKKRNSELYLREYNTNNTTTLETEEEDEEKEKRENEKGKKRVKGGVPSTVAKNHFRRSLSSATSMVFHRHTGLPLTSSPAPLRKGKESFDFDSSIHTPQDIKRVLYESQSGKGKVKRLKLTHHSPSGKRHISSVTSSNLLCNFEESVLNGRLEPVSTVEGFTAEIGASGTFHPKHMTFAVTVFFYTLCDNSTISSPYLGHINIGKKGYRVPEKGTVQVTLFNPLGTVVKMFVVLYDLSDMPPNSQTFLRQRTLYMASEDSISPEPHKSLRYLIHLRFASSKSGKIYIHTDIRMIIFRKSDLDTATDHSLAGFELRSFTKGPVNPKFSLRK